jgi:hypothetical protein
MHAPLWGRPGELRHFGIGTASPLNGTPPTPASFTHHTPWPPKTPPTPSRQYHRALDLRQGLVLFHRSGDAPCGLHGNSKL